VDIEQAVLGDDRREEVRVQPRIAAEPHEHPPSGLGARAEVPVKRRPDAALGTVGGDDEVGRGDVGQAALTAQVDLHPDAPGGVEQHGEQLRVRDRDPAGRCHGADRARPHPHLLAGHDDAGRDDRVERRAVGFPYGAQRALRKGHAEAERLVGHGALAYPHNGVGQALFQEAGGEQPGRAAADDLDLVQLHTASILMSKYYYAIVISRRFPATRRQAAA
jgi:hypothetical protein